MGAVHHRDGHGSRRAEDPLAGRAARQRPDESLARGAEYDRPAEDLEPAQPPVEIEVVLQTLPESDPRVDQDPFPVDPCGRREVHPRGQLPDHLAEQAIVVGPDLHRGRDAPPVHEDHRAARLPDDGRQLRVVRKGARVVHDPRSRRNRLPGHGRLRRVDGEDRLRLPRKLAEHRQDPPQLLLRRDRFRPGARGLSADVYDRRAVLRHPESALRRLQGRAERAAVRERVRRDVQDPHDQRRAGQVEAASGDGDDETFQAGAPASSGEPPCPPATPSSIIRWISAPSMTSFSRRVLATLCST